MQKNKPTPFVQNAIFSYLKMRAFKKFRHLRKDGHQKVMKIRSTNLENLGYEINIYQKT